MVNRKRNPLDDSLTELMDAWMELMDVTSAMPNKVKMPLRGGKNNLGDWEDRDGIIAITVDMPGVEKEDIVLNVDKNSVTVEAKKESRDYSFSKTFTQHLNPEATTAEFNNGVLDIKIEKAEEYKGKQIDIK
jgi:HSP20 family molecular chaperone IbpA